MNSNGALTCYYFNSTSLTKSLYHKPLQIPISDFKLLATFDLLLVFSLIDFRLILFLKIIKPSIYKGLLIIEFIKFYISNLIHLLIKFLLTNQFPIFVCFVSTNDFQHSTTQKIKKYEQDTTFAQEHNFKAFTALPSFLLYSFILQFTTKYYTLIITSISYYLLIFSAFYDYF